MTPLRCPHCVAELQLQSGLQLSACPQCRGVFCGWLTLKQLIDQARRALRAELYQRPEVSFGAPVKYLRCPACDQLMDRHNFAVRSGVVVDVCARHGVWFDDGELPKVLHFCASEQFPDLKQLDQLLRQGQRGAQVMPLAFPDKNSLDTSPKPIEQMSPREMALDVLSFLRLLIP
jgi:Zn-finger nucleic acid-binding protein